MRMSLEEKKQHKYFYRNALRLVGIMAILSYLVMGLIIFGIYTVLINQREPMYYATNSAGVITPLKRLTGPNLSSEALLAPDPAEEANEKGLD